MEELIIVQLIFLKYSYCKILIFANVSEDGLAVVLGNILRLACFGAFKISGLILIGLIGILGVAVVDLSSFSYFFIYLFSHLIPTFLPIVIELGGIFSISGGIILTILFALGGLGRSNILGLHHRGDKLVISEKFLIQMIGEVQKLTAVLIEIVEVGALWWISVENRYI